MIDEAGWFGFSCWYFRRGSLGVDGLAPSKSAPVWFRRKLPLFRFPGQKPLVGSLGPTERTMCMLCCWDYGCSSTGVQVRFLTHVRVGILGGIASTWYPTSFRCYTSALGAGQNIKAGDQAIEDWEVDSRIPTHAWTTSKKDQLQTPGIFDFYFSLILDLSRIQLFSVPSRRVSLRLLLL